MGIASRGNDGEITFREWHPVGVIEYGYVAPDPLHPNIVYGAGRSRGVKVRLDHGAGAERNAPLCSAASKYRTDRTEPIVFSPVDPHILYYAANVLFQDQTMAASRGRPSAPTSPGLIPAFPASLGDLAAKDEYAAKVRGAIYALAPSFKDINTLWAGTDDGLIWITRDGGKKWTNITPPGVDPVEQGDADLRLALR